MKYIVIILCFMVSNCNSTKEAQKDMDNTPSIPQGKYVVTTINQNKVATQKPLTIVFNSDNKTISGYAGCNQYGCSYQFGDRKILSFGMVKATRMYCEKTMETETEMLQALAKVKNYRLQDNVLTLLQGNTILMTAKASK